MAGRRPAPLVECGTRRTLRAKGLFESGRRIRGERGENRHAQGQGMGHSRKRRQQDCRTPKRTREKLAGRHGTKCGATIPISSREVMILVFFQNLGKWRWLPVTR